MCCRQLLLQPTHSCWQGVVEFVSVCWGSTNRLQNPTAPAQRSTTPLLVRRSACCAVSVSQSVGGMSACFVLVMVVDCVLCQPLLGPLEGAFKAPSRAEYSIADIHVVVAAVLALWRSQLACIDHVVCNKPGTVAFGTVTEELPKSQQQQRVERSATAASAQPASKSSHTANMQACCKQTGYLAPYLDQPTPTCYLLHAVAVTNSWRGPTSALGVGWCCVS